MSDLAPRPQNMHAELAALAVFADTARAVHGIAQSLAPTAFVPTSMRNKPEEVTGAILAGAELGLSPMAALASIDLIEGRPAVRANTMRGLLLAAGGEIEVVEANDTRVIMRARLRPNRPWQEVTWTLDRAKKMGLATKSNWQKMPQAMMVARATSELVRLVAAHLLIGMPYSTEELGDEPMPEAPATAPAARNERRTMQRAGDWKEVGHTDGGTPVYVAPVGTPAPAPQPEPEGRVIGRGEPAKEIEAPPAPDGDKVTDTTRKAIMAGFNELGIRARDARLARVGEVVGRDIPSVNVLTEAEARQVVTYLQGQRTEKSNAEDAPAPATREKSDYDWPELTPAAAS